MVSTHLSLSPTPSLHATCAFEPAAVAPDGLKQGHGKMMMMMMMMMMCRCDLH